MKKILIKTSLLLIITFFVNGFVYSQPELAKWRGTDSIITFMCNKFVINNNDTISRHFYVGLSKKQYNIRGQLYKRLSLDFSPRTLTGYIRNENNKVFIRFDKRSKEYPFLIFPKKMIHFRTQLPDHRTSNLSGAIITLDSMYTKNNGNRTYTAYKFRVSNKYVSAADSDNLISITASIEGIIEVRIDTRYFALNCKCEND